ncbi:MlaD family protein, partial [Burkholderia multivorans]|uniref:MlaD family protein n=1 Tax=Burkholderia multivorans TaxID=87883 RepID=UPI000DB83C44
MNSPQGPQHDESRPPDPTISTKSGWLPSLVWLVPLIGIGLVVRSVRERGPEITISFHSAEGLEPGKTQVKYKDVEIGMVKTIKLSKDLSRVLVEVQLKKEAEDFAVKDSRFWIVRPRVGATGVSGLGTLLSGAYIGVDAGRSQDVQTDFTGLEKPPAVTADQKGT